MGRISHTVTPERKPQRLECCCSHVAILALARLAGIVYALLRDGSERKAEGAFYKHQMLTYLNPQMRTFIARQEMFFLSTADSHGECDVSFRAGEPGFVHVFNEKILVYPEYRGNGPAWATSPRTHTRGCSSSREADATLRARDARQDRTDQPHHTEEVGFKHRPDELLRSFLNRTVSADTSVVDEDVNPAGLLLDTYTARSAEIGSSTSS
jgi:predicted pyridoxine 5'-phosphate oxidase superfamily flavin-nucleotide-binding protein